MLQLLLMLGLIATLSSQVASQGVYNLPYGGETEAINPCPTGVQVIGVSGQGSADEGQYGLLGTLVSNITASIPGSFSEPLSYPKLELEKAELTNAGVENLNAYLTDFHKQCPTTPIVLAGYSAGGVISFNTLCGGFAPFAITPPLDSSFASTIIAIVTYGEETHAAGQSYDAGSCTASAPNVPRTNTAACAPFAPNIQDYCLSSDPNCCSTGTDNSTHYDYPQYYDITATQYVLNKYNAYVAAMSSASSSLSSSMASSTSAASSTGSSTAASVLASSSLVLSSKTAIVMPTSTAALETSVALARLSSMASTIPSITTTQSQTSTGSVPNFPEMTAVRTLSTMIHGSVSGATATSNAAIEASGHPASAIAVTPSSAAAAQPALSSNMAPAEPTSAPASSSGYSAPYPTGSVSSGSAPISGSSPGLDSPTSEGGCPGDLSGTWQFPHLIVPISSESPSTAYGTSYYANISSAVSTIFNFDIPGSYAGMTCSLLFFLPNEEDILYSQYTTSGDGSIHAEQLADVATESTSYDNAPALSKDLGDFSIKAPQTRIISTAPCQAGDAVAFELSGNDYSLNFFEMSANNKPIGLFMRAC